MQTSTENILREIRYERNRQKAMHFKDEAHTKGELISAAISYADFAKKQIHTRDMQAIEEYKNTSGQYRKPIPPGGTSAGYTTTGPLAAVPASWPFSTSMWIPGSHGRNLIRAAALIVAELERMENVDRALFSVPNRRPKYSIGRVVTSRKNSLLTDDDFLPSWNGRSVSVNPIYSGKIYGSSPTHTGATASTFIQ